MADSNRNRHGGKESDKESRTKHKDEENCENRKLSDNKQNASDESTSTRGNTAGDKYSKTDKRDDEIDNEETRGGL